MKRLIPALFGLFFIAAFVVIVAFPPRAQMQLAVENSGFQNVQLTGFAVLGCSEHDTFRQRWVGRNATGKLVSGVVCGGLTKAWTIRLF